MTMKEMRISVSFLLLFAVAAGCSKSEVAGNPEISEDLRHGIKCLQKGDYDCAIKEFEEEMLLEETSEGFSYLGMAFRMKYNDTKKEEWKNNEIDAFEKAINLDDTSVIAYKNLAYTFYGLGEKKKAANLFTHALALNPNDPEKKQLEKIIEEGLAEE